MVSISQVYRVDGVLRFCYAVPVLGLVGGGTPRVADSPAAGACRVFHNSIPPSKPLPPRNAQRPPRIASMLTNASLHNGRGLSTGIGDRVLFHPAPREPRHEWCEVYRPSGT